MSEHEDHWRAGLTDLTLGGNDFLYFRTLSSTGKTVIREVVSMRHNNRLGTIRWFGRWRQYVFAPEPGTVYNPGCLDAINTEIRTLMEQRRKK